MKNIEENLIFMGFIDGADECDIDRAALCDATVDCRCRASALLSPCLIHSYIESVNQSVSESVSRSIGRWIL